MRRFLLVALVPIMLTPAAPATASTAVTKTPIAFEVVNPQDPAATWTIRGHVYTADGCSPTSALLLLHGLSYGQWGWDFPIDPDTYSVARALARAGYAVVAIDELGYDTSGGDSDPEGRQLNGYQVTVGSYADMTAQIVDDLRGSGFTEVGLVGHSAGTEISELTAAIHRNVDVVVATAYHHFPSQRIVADFLTGDVVRAAFDDYEYFGEDAAQRAEYMYNLDVARPDVVAQDTALANLTPSGEVWSIAGQPSGKVLQAIDVPVLLVLAEADLLFPPTSDYDGESDNGSNELALFAASPDKELHVVPDAGHSFMLHPNAPDTNDVIASWLTDGRLTDTC